MKLNAERTAGVVERERRVMRLAADAVAVVSGEGRLLPGAARVGDTSARCSLRLRAREAAFNI